MLGPIRKFSSSIYAKILLCIIIIPFIFWGMGGSFRGGSKNIVVVIDKEKYSAQDLGNFINLNSNEKVKSDEVERYLTAFIGEKLLEKEMEEMGINVSDLSLSKLIKNQKEFKRNNEFSRTEYEKFLLKSNITAVNFESILSLQEKKKQLLDFIGGGISPSEFLVNVSYNKINQKRNIELINLSNIFDKKINFTEEEIKTFFINNEEKYTKSYRSINLLELTPNKLVSDSEFTDLFFKKIDEIDDSIILGEKLDAITKKYNLTAPTSYTINEYGININGEKNKEIPEDLIKKIFEISDSESTVFVENKNKYFVIELIKTEKIKMNLEDQSIRNEIVKDLKNKTKREFTSKIIDRINKNEFNKSDFDKLSKAENAKVQKIKLNSNNDNKILEMNIVYQIYLHPEKKVVVVSDIGFSEIYLVYIDKIESVKIDKYSDEYKKYIKVSQSKIVNELFNTYDIYIKNKYKIDINYQALDIFKNYFN